MNPRFPSLLSLTKITAYSIVWPGAARSMKVNITGHVTGPQKASITVAEIKGSEFPDERVIIGGHFWIRGISCHGATDDGTGSMAVLEAARTIKALGLTPKRTITFILFTGEEQGGVGVRTYLENHKDQIPEDRCRNWFTIRELARLRVSLLKNFYETAPIMGQNLLNRCRKSLIYSR